MSHLEAHLWTENTDIVQHPASCCFHMSVLGILLWAFKLLENGLFKTRTTTCERERFDQHALALAKTSPPMRIPCLFGTGHLCWRFKDCRMSKWLLNSKIEWTFRTFDTLGGSPSPLFSLNPKPSAYMALPSFTNLYPHTIIFSSLISAYSLSICQLIRDEYLCQH